MTKDEIKKALECCITEGSFHCNYCPYFNQLCCQDVLCKDALDLIAEQEKEIEFQVQDRARLQREIDELEQAHEQRVEEIEQLKAKITNLKDDFDSLQKDYEFVRDCDAEHCLEINETVKQAKIDVLTELREKCSVSGSVDNNWATYVYVDNIDEMIEELKNDN